MSRNERKRVTVMAGVQAAALTLVQAGELMGVCYRQSKRIWQRYQAEGDAGLVHRLRGQRQRAQNGGAASAPLRPPSTPPPPAKLPSKKWRDLILQVWHTDPLICPKCQRPMRVIAVIDQLEVVEKILRHLGLWSGGQALAPARPPPDTDVGPWIREPFDDVDPMPDYENALTD